MIDKDLANSPNISHLALAILYFITCALVYKLRKANVEIHISANLVAILISVLFTLILWGMLTAHLAELLNFKSFSKELKMSLQFLNGPAVTLVITCILAFPLCNLFKRTFWVPPVIASFVVLATESSLFLDSTTNLFKLGIVTTDFICLCLLAPGIMWLMRKYILTSAQNDL